MATEVLTKENSGSRGTSLNATVYAGGKENGKCVQLTQRMENGELGYVQLTENDLRDVLEALQDYALAEAGLEVELDEVRMVEV